MARISACIQVGGKFKATMFETLGSGRVTCHIYGQVERHWGLVPVPGATYIVDSVGANSLDELRAEARKRIDQLNAGGSLLMHTTSRADYERCYQR